MIKNSSKPWLGVFFLAKFMTQVFNLTQKTTKFAGAKLTLTLSSSLWYLATSCLIWFPRFRSLMVAFVPPPFFPPLPLRPCYLSTLTLTLSRSLWYLATRCLIWLPRFRFLLVAFAPPPSPPCHIIYQHSPWLCPAVSGTWPPVVWSGYPGSGLYWLPSSSLLCHSGCRSCFVD